MRLHPDPRRLHQAPAGQRVPGAGPRRQGHPRHGHQGGGLCDHGLHRLHPRLYPLLHLQRPRLHQEGLPDPGGGAQRQGHQHRQHPARGERRQAREGQRHDPRPRYGRRALPLLRDEGRHRQAHGPVGPAQHPLQRHPGHHPGGGGRADLRPAHQRPGEYPHRHQKRHGRLL